MAIQDGANLLPIRVAHLCDVWRSRSSLAQAQQPPAKPPGVPPGVKVVHDLPYVENGHERQKLDLYLPEKMDGLLPVVVWVHGPQPFPLGSTDALRQRLERRRDGPLIYDLQVVPGPDRIAERLAGTANIVAVPRFATAGDRPT